MIKKKWHGRIYWLPSALVRDAKWVYEQTGSVGRAERRLRAAGYDTIRAGLAALHAAEDADRPTDEKGEADG